MVNRRVKYFLLVVIAGWAYSAMAQEKAATLSGHITDRFGSSIDGVQIAATASNGKVFKSVSKADGTYVLDLRPDVYSISFKRAPFKDFILNEFQIADVSKMSLDISLICEGCVLIEDHSA